MTAPIRPDGPVVTPLERGEGTPFVSPSMRREAPEGIAGETPSFSDLFKRALNDTSTMQEDSKEMIAAFLRGEPVELHQVMAASEEASISLELLVEIRNKLTDAYRTIMNMQ
jgi:flagellar hook-basal body complex protein FliE